MDIVFVNSTSGNIEIIPRFLKKEEILVLTDSEAVVHQCIKENINYQTIGNYIDYSKLRIINQKIIIDQRKFIERLYDKLKNYNYYSEILRDYIYSYNFEFYKLNHSLKIFFQKNKINKIYFVYDENLFMSPDSSPKGYIIPYLLILKFSKIYKFKIYLYLRNKLKLEEEKFHNYYMKFYKFKNKNNKKNLKDLYFFTFNQCYTDLLSCLDCSKNDILTFRTNKNIFGKFNYENKKYKIDKFKKKKLKQIHNILKFNLENQFKKSFLNSDFFNLKILLNHINKQIWLKLLEFESIKMQLTKEIKLDKIENIYLSGVSFNYPIASFLNYKKKKVIIRQHGGLSYPSWPNLSQVKDCKFITNSKALKKNILPWNNKIESLPRYSFEIDYKNKLKNKKKKFILIAEGSFENSVNIKIYYDFYKNLFKNMDKSYSFKFRCHPRFKSNLYSHFKKTPNVSFDKFKNINDILSSSIMVLINYDTPNSVFQDAILNGVPVFLISPKERVKSHLYEDNCYGFPYICKNQDDLNQYMIKIKNKVIKDKILLNQKKWCSKVFGHYILNKKIKLFFNTKKEKKNFLYFFKLYLKNFFKKIFFKILLLYLKFNKKY
jgi:hypothetical protein